MSAGQRLYEQMFPDGPGWESLTTAQQNHYELLLDNLAAGSVSRAIWRVLKLLQYYDLDGLHWIEMGQEYVNDEGHMQVADHVCGPFWLLRIKPNVQRPAPDSGASPTVWPVSPTPDLKSW